jgi:hypothetical protein
LNRELITLDGGPHTLWWPTQGPDGTFLPHDIPPPQILRLMQPTAKFILTLSDPAKRFYSDYFFLGDDLRPLAPSSDPASKSVQQLHERAEEQVELFYSCIDHYIQTMEQQIVDQQLVIPMTKGVQLTLPKKYANKIPLWFRASQM